MFLSKKVYFLPLLLYATLCFSDQMVDAQGYFDKKEYRAAAIVLKNLLQKTPTNQDARLLLGKVYLAGLDSASAIKELERARDLGATADDYLLPLSRAYLFSGLEDKIIALEEYAGSLRSIRLKSEFLTVLGYAYLNKSQYQEAKRSFAEALEADVNVVSLVGNSRIALLDNNRERAMQMLDQALAMDAENIEALVAKANVLASREKWGEAISLFSEVLDRAPNLGHIRMLRAELYAQVGNSVAARKDAEQVLERNAKDVKANYILSLLELQDRNYEQARVYSEHVLRNNPRHLMAPFVLGTAHYAQQNYEQAQYYLEKFIAHQPQHSLGIRLLGASYTRTNQPLRARELLEDFESRFPHDDAELLNLLGTMQLYFGDFESATQSFNRALAIEPALENARDKLILSRAAKGELGQIISELEQTEAERKARDHLLLILSHIKQGDHDKAHEQLDIAIRKYPGNSNFYHLKGTVYLKAGETQKARDAFRQSLAKNAYHVPTLISLANLEGSNNNQRDAAGWLQKILQFDDSHLHALMGLAQLSERQGDGQSMLSWLEMARHKNPDSSVPVKFLVDFYLKNNELSKAYGVASLFYTGHKNIYQAISLMARVSIAVNKLDEAQFHLEQLIAISDKDLYHRHQIVEVLIQKKEYERAVKFLDEILSVRPRDTRMLTIKARALIALEKYAEASKVISKIDKYYPENYLVNQLQGDLDLALGRPESALAAYRLGFSKQQSTYLADSLFKLYVDDGRLEEAVKVMERYLEEVPRDHSARVRMAGIYQQLKDNKQAIKHYETLVNEGVANYLVLNNIAGLYWQEGDERSLVTAKKAYELAPNSAEVSDTYGWIMLHLGDKKDALKIIQRSASRSPTNPSIRYHLAKAYVENGQQVLARRELAQLLKKDTHFAERDQALMLAEELGNL